MRLCVLATGNALLAYAEATRTAKSRGHRPCLGSIACALRPAQMPLLREQSNDMEASHDVRTCAREKEVRTAAARSLPHACSANWLPVAAAAPAPTGSGYAELAVRTLMPAPARLRLRMLCGALKLRRRKRAIEAGNMEPNLSLAATLPPPSWSSPKPRRSLL